MYILQFYCFFPSRQGGLKAVMVSEEASSKLVNVCETGPGSVKMPYTIQLVKQLRKELNLEKIVKEFKKVGCEWVFLKIASVRMNASHSVTRRTFGRVGGGGEERRREGGGRGKGREERRVQEGVCRP